MCKTAAAADHGRVRSFLWVNKTPESANLSRSTPTEMQDIQRFVQHNFKTRSKKRQNHFGEMTHDFSVRSGSSRKKDVRCEALDSGYEAFNSRLSRWRVISPRAATAHKSGKSPKDVPMTMSSATCKMYKSLRHTSLDLDIHSTPIPIILPAKPSFEVHLTAFCTPEDKTRISTRLRQHDINSRDFYGYFQQHVSSSSGGLPTVASESHISNLVQWSANYEDVFLGIVLGHQCWVLCHDSSSNVQRSHIEILRSRFLQELDARLVNGTVDEVLIQVILLAIDIDAYLGHSQFLNAHMNALEAIFRHWDIADFSISENSKDFLLTSVLMAHFHTCFANGQDTLSCSSPSSSSIDDDFTWLVSSFPPGFHILALEGYLSLSMIQILALYFGQAFRATHSLIMEVKIRAVRALSELTLIDMSVLIAVLHLIGDEMDRVNCTACLLWREPYQITMTIMDQPQLWEDPWLDGLLVWLVTVFMTEDVLLTRGKDFVQKLLTHRTDISDFDGLESILRQFVSPESNMKLWRSAWEAKFDQ